VLLHEVEVSPELTLYLITNLDLDGLSAANIYQRRYDVEFDIRDLKVTLDTENIRAKKRRDVQEGIVHLGDRL